MPARSIITAVGFMLTSSFAPGLSAATSAPASGVVGLPLPVHGGGAGPASAGDPLAVGADARRQAEDMAEAASRRFDEVLADEMRRAGNPSAGPVAATPRSGSGAAGADRFAQSERQSELRPRETTDVETDWLLRPIQQWLDRANRDYSERVVKPLSEGAGSRSGLSPQPPVVAPGPASAPTPRSPVRQIETAQAPPEPRREPAVSGGGLFDPLLGWLERSNRDYQNRVVQPLRDPERLSVPLAGPTAEPRTPQVPPSVSSPVRDLDSEAARRADAERRAAEERARMAARPLPAAPSLPQRAPTAATDPAPGSQAPPTEAAPTQSAPAQAPTRLGDLQLSEEARRQIEAQRIEADRRQAEARRIEETQRRQAEARRLDEERRAAEQRRLIDEQQRQADAQRSEAERRRQEEQRQAEARRLEAEKQAAERRRQEEQRQAEARRLEAEKQTAERVAAERRRQDEQRQADRKREEADRATAEARRLEDLRQVELRRLEASRKAAEERAANERRETDQRQVTDDGKAALTKSLAEARRAQDAADRAAQAGKKAQDAATLVDGQRSAARIAAEAARREAAAASPTRRSLAQREAARVDSVAASVAKVAATASDASRRAAADVRAATDAARVAEEARKAAASATDPRLRRSAEQRLAEAVMRAEDAARRAEGSAQVAIRASEQQIEEGSALVPAPESVAPAREAAPGGARDRVRADARDVEATVGTGVAGTTTRIPPRDRVCRRTAGKKLAKLPGVYIVDEGDTLWAIADKHYGNGERYSRIWRANEKVLGDVDVIYPCLRLKIPKR